MPKKIKEPNTRGIYPNYLFKDHDPVLDQIDRLIELSGKTTTQIVTKSGVTRSTLRNWALRKTKRPQHPTIRAVVKACGGSYTMSYKGKEIRGYHGIRTQL